jgi:hypothetical protein
MRTHRRTVATLSIVVAVASWAAVMATQSRDAMPLEPVARSGESVTPAFEGWYPNPDRSFSLLLGYYNRNQTQVLDIPAGPNNRIEPGGPDQGQPPIF